MIFVIAIVIVIVIVIFIAIADMQNVIFFTRSTLLSKKYTPKSVSFFATPNLKQSSKSK